MPATPEKKIAKKAPPVEKNPALSAVEEVTSDSFTVDFRGEKFTVARNVLSSARFQLFFASDRGSDLMLELIGHDRTDQDRFIATLLPGEGLSEIAGEFFQAVNAATGSGNS